MAPEMLIPWRLLNGAGRLVFWPSFSDAEGSHQLLFQKERDQQELLGGKLAETRWEMYVIPRENHLRLRREAGNQRLSENLWERETPTCPLFGPPLFSGKATPREVIVEQRHITQKGKESVISSIPKE